MADYTYTRNVTGDGNYSITSLIAKDVETALPGKVFTVHCIGTEVKFTFENTLSASEETTLTNLVNSFDLPTMDFRPRHEEEEFDKRGKLVRRTFFATDDNGTLKDKYEEYTWSYDSAGKALLSESYVKYRADGSSEPAVITNYETEKVGSSTILRKRGV